MVYSLHQAGVFQRMVGKNKFTAPCSDDFEMISAYQVFEFLEIRLVGHKIVALRVEPEPLESRVVDEDVWSARGIRPIFKIKVASVQDQGVALYIKRYGRQCPVIMVHDQLSLGRLQQRFGERA
jgi:hypothetical protein